MAIVRLDGDLYQSTTEGLANLYPTLSPGGFLIVDDWGAMPPCKQAVEDYRRTNGITEPDDADRLDRRLLAQERLARGRASARTGAAVTPIIASSPSSRRHHVHLFWKSVVKPVLDAVSPSVIVEVGAAEGRNTRNLAAYALDCGSVLHVIDPTPQFEEEDVAQGLGDSFVLHRARSLNALPEIAEPDVVLLDGDHNWYTVYHELQLLEKGARRAERPLPTVLLHDVDWPYGRRDLYYDPEAIPPAYRLPYKQEGLLPDSAEPVGARGLNTHLNNAIYTHDFRNGVRTAVEDFMSESERELCFQTVPGNHGIGILTPNPAGVRGAAGLRHLLAELASPEFLLDQGRRIEELRVDSLIKSEEEQRRRRAAEAQAEQAVTDVQAARDATRSEREAAAARLEQSAHALDEAEERAAAAELERSELIAQLDVQAEAVKAAQTATANADQALAEVAEQLTDLQSERDTIAAELEQSAQALRRSDEQLAATELERDKLAAQLEVQAEAVKAAQTATANADQALANAEQQLANLDDERNATAARLEESGHAHREAEKRAAAAELERDELTAQLDVQAEALKKLGLQLADETRKAGKGERALRASGKKERQLRAEVAAITLRQAEMRKVLESRERELLVLREKRDESEQTLATVERTIELERGEARARQQSLVEATLTLRQVRDHLDRIEQSRSWRFGHAFFGVLRRLTLRRVVGSGAVAAARENVQRALESADHAAVGPPLERPRKVAPSSKWLGLDGAEPPPAATEEERRALAEQLRERLGPPPSTDGTPLVSIVVVNRNGRTHLKRLLDSLDHETDYRRFEVIVVDNASTDGAVDLLRVSDHSFPLKVKLNDYNASFSQANNQGAELADGELLLLLNNDVQPVESAWLGELVGSHRRTGAGATGALLLHADAHRPTPSGWEIQHRGIRFRGEDGLLKGFNEGAGEDGLEGMSGVDEECPAVTAACLLVSAELYHALGGLHSGYSYGTEDVDFCLCLQERGQRVVCCSRTVLLHHESSTQNSEGREFMRVNRLGNRQLFHERWGPRLWRQAALDRLTGGALWMPATPPSIVITRTSHDQREGFGDWYTAEEIGAALRREGFDVAYIEARGGSWHSPDISADYVLALLDRYDPAHAPAGATSIAWIRNWAERWIERPQFQQYSVLLASSETTVGIVERETGRHAHLFPLATNPVRFHPVEPEERYASDYVFTGNRWDAERPIETAARPETGERFRLFGSGWEKSKRLKRWAEGSVPYDELATVYSSTKIVVDDAASHTLPYDSVNSRVFDALACGTLVLTNGVGGVRALFDDDFPTYESASSLRAALNHLLADEQLRKRLAQRYSRVVLDHHTYRHRARTLKRILRERLHSLRFCIKIGAPNWEVAHRWGDLHFARALQRELRACGHESLIQVLPEWDSLEGLEYDVVVHLRGLSHYRPKAGQFNMLWNISHPDLVSGAECDGYDLVCVASHRFASTLRDQTRTPVHVLEQATDPKLFRPDPDHAFAHDLAFVGNSRKVERRILRDLLPTRRDLAVWGNDWHGLLPSRHVVGDYLDPEEVRKVYSSAAIVLNDHWDDMRDHGFISNRIYDALACGAFVISDRLEEIDERFDGIVVTYEGREELQRLIDSFMDDPEERERRGQRGRELVLAEHTFGQRVDELISLIDVRWRELGFSSTILPERGPAPLTNGVGPPRGTSAASIARPLPS